MSDQQSLAAWAAAQRQALIALGLDEQAARAVEGL